MRITKRRLRRIIRETLLHELVLETDEEAEDTGDDRDEPPEIEIEDPGRIRDHGRS
jgi:hypothetical protein